MSNNQLLGERQAKKKFRRCLRNLSKTFDPEPPVKFRAGPRPLKRLLSHQLLNSEQFYIFLRKSNDIVTF